MLPNFAIAACATASTCARVGYVQLEQRHVGECLEQVAVLFNAAHRSGHLPTSPCKLLHGGFAKAAVGAGDEDCLGHKPSLVLLHLEAR